MLDRLRTGRLLVILAAAVAIIAFLLVSNNLVKELARQERERMDIWANATARLAKAGVDSDFEFLLAIISQNNTIPVLISDSNFNISEFRNFSLPDKQDADKSLYSELSPRNQEYLLKRLRRPGGDTPLSEMARRNDHFIEVDLFDGERQYIYYEDSTLLRRLSLYPYIQLGVMIILVLILYMAVVNTKRAEQNRVWVGLSKETAHQLGTPISSLMAWMELLESLGVDADTVAEMNKDVHRLSTIASRFGKIGSKPQMECGDVNLLVEKAAGYMSSRISKRIKVTVITAGTPLYVNLSDSLFEWVMENLIKNAVDAMDADGSITITLHRERDNACIEVTDTGKGLPRKRFNTIFNPGYTTKKRGWGLGLTLAKRIIEQYHSGKIYVASSEIGVGTTFRIDLPLCEPKD